MARIYRAEILRACFGPGAAPAQAVDLPRLNQIAERLAQGEDVHGILRAKGYGAAGVSLPQLVRDVPSYAPPALKDLFQPVEHEQAAPMAEWQTFNTEQIARYFRIPPELLADE